MADDHLIENTFWGPEEVRKRCIRCGKSKPLGEFYVCWHKQMGKKRRLPRCKECERIRMNAVKRILDPERQRRKGRQRNLGRYGLDEEGYQKMLAKQDGLCAICGQPESARTTT